MISHFFIDRPVFATVISVVIVLIGVVAAALLPVAQYPEVAPPTISVTAIYPGANAKVVADTVAAPIEQEVNGVERMLYMSSRCTNDGQMALDITFELGTNLDTAQVLVQNRVAIAQSKLPDEVKRQGVTTKKKSPAILLCVNLISPDNSYDQLFLSNYALLQVKDSLARLKGVGDVTFLGARDYSMRIWLDPEKLASRNLTAADALTALKEQNVQVAAGRIGQPPAPAGLDFEMTISTQGRLLDADEFADIIIKTGDTGQITRIRDVARTELGAKNYDVSSSLDGQPSITLAVFQLPGSNALATADAVKAEMKQMKTNLPFPAGIDYRIVYDTTVFIDESIHDVYKTLAEAFVLVFIVVLVFLQDWKATILPMIDVPVSLIGTFAVMKLLGFSLNNLTLFGMVLAIGIVVDDAIVVLEAVETWMARGLNARDATRKAMEEITGPIIAITLVLCSVFIPTAFLAGISGEFYRQFALTIAASTVISAINAMTMTPSRCVQIFGKAGHGGEGHGHAHQKEALPRWGIAIIVGALCVWKLAPHFGGGHPAAGGHGAADEIDTHLWLVRGACFVGGSIVGWLIGRRVQLGLDVFFGGFNKAFEVASNLYGKTVGRVLRLAAVMLLLYAGLMGLTVLGFRSVPIGFIPEQDKGYLVVAAQLPDGASAERTAAVVQRIDEITRKTEGVAHTIAIPGYSILSSVNISNFGGMFVILDEFEHRKHDPNLSARAVVQRLRTQFADIQDAQIVAFGAPPVDGLGTTAGMKMQVQDRGDAGFDSLQESLTSLTQRGNQTPGVAGVFTTFRASQPQLFVEVDRTKAKASKVVLNDVFTALQANLGSAYANDFTRFGRNWQVNVQADASFRQQVEDIGRLKVRNADGKMVPLATLINVRDTTGPALVNHFNMFPSADVIANTPPGFSSGDSIAVMEELGRQELPPGMSTEWSEIALQQILASKDILTKLVFPLGVIFVFLVLAAQYESWSMPVAIILIVPMCLLAAIFGVWLAGLDNNIFTQIGLVVLVG
ncbi:MAG: efflux RND transporter permease subunit, partial [Planctomycetales bacterium]|nr:efflux RND transporter permease subunit [Planctomycetales bacterium]